MTIEREVLSEIYNYWFGEGSAPDAIDPVRIEFWMRQDDRTDEEVRTRFGHLLPEAAAEEWDLSQLSHEEGVALVVLFDQFPRNIYRTTDEAFAYDDIARALARRLTCEGWDRFTAMERFILGLPFVHHEDIADQDYAVLLACEIVVTAADDQKALHRHGLDQAIRHRELIRRFGRFPHRNAMLGRASSPEELAFMQEHGRGF
jgi:uncharacterized protein (DUF924 family)